MYDRSRSDHFSFERGFSYVVDPSSFSLEPSLLIEMGWLFCGPGENPSSDSYVTDNIIFFRAAVFLDMSVSFTIAEFWFWFYITFILLKVLVKLRLYLIYKSNILTILNMLCKSFVFCPTRNIDVPSSVCA